MQKQFTDLALSDTLRGAVEESGALIRIGYPAWLRAFVRRNVVAITLGRRVYVSRRLVDEGEERLESILRHELVHVGQVRRLGLVRFLALYAREYLSNRRRGLEAGAAYEAISFEVEARAAEDPSGVRIAERALDPNRTL